MTLPLAIAILVVLVLLLLVTIANFAILDKIHLWMTTPKIVRQTESKENARTG